MAISIAALRQSLKYTEITLKQAGDSYHAEKAKVATLTEQLADANAVIASYNDLKAALVEVEPEPQYLQIGDGLNLEIGKKYRLPNWQINDWWAPTHLEGNKIWGKTSAHNLPMYYIDTDQARMLELFAEPQP